MCVIGVPRQSGARTKQFYESVECALGPCRVNQDAVVHIGRGGRRPDEPTVERAVVIRRLGKLRQDLVRRRTGFVCRRAVVGTSGRGVGSGVLGVGRGRRGDDANGVTKTQRVGVSGEVVAAAWGDVANNRREAWMNINDKPRRVSQEWTWQCHYALVLLVVGWEATDLVVRHVELRAGSVAS